ncbi:MAG: TPM domain-containing protein [Kiritimatiellales bacterium]|nr:TPM domain-containing protein [Kiritimatiellales bacterium]
MILKSATVFLMRRLLILFSMFFLASAQADTDRLLQSLKPDGHVNDFAGVMSSSDRAATERLLTELEQKTGAQVAVVSLKSLDGGQIGDFSTRLFERWGIGQKGKDNGILLLGATGEGRGNRLQIEVGYGLEGVIPDAAAGRILDNYVLPGWSQGQYGAAMANGAAAIAQRIAADKGVTLSGMPTSMQRTPAKRGFPLMNIILLLIFIPFAIRHPWILLMLLSSGGGSRGGGFGGGGFGGFGGGMSGGGGASR